MTSTKDIESKAYEHLERYVAQHLPGAKLRDERHKGRGKGTAIGDAVLEYQGKSTHIEIKSSESKTLPTNLRFTHQTISSAQGEHLIVALVWNLKNGETPNIGFFNLGSVQRKIVIEPHFIVQSKHLTGKAAIAGVFSPDLGLLLESESLPLDSLRHFRTACISVCADEAKTLSQQHTSGALPHWPIPHWPIP